MQALTKTSNLNNLFSSIGIFLNVKSRNPVISEAPSTYENAIWLQDTRNKNRCARCTLTERCNLCLKNIISEVNLIKFESESETKKVLNKSKLLPVSSFNDA